MNTNFILPNSIGYLLIAFGVVAVVLYLKATIYDIKAARLVDYYKAAAYGDPDDFSYWEETAKQFDDAR